MAQKIIGGIYATPGGYELYCNHHDNMVAQYRAEHNKGVRTKEILEQFLREKSLEKNSILQADKKLTENEKNIHEKRALAEQAVKMEAEKQQQLEKLTQERKRSHQEGIRQLEAKMGQEAKEKQHELERAIDRKLQEQEKLMAKGFMEKEAVMKVEIQSLREKEARREEKEEESRNSRAITQGIVEDVSNGITPGSDTLVLLAVPPPQTLSICTVENLQLIIIINYNNQLNSMLSIVIPKCHVSSHCSPPVL